MSPAPGDGDPESPEISVLSCHRVRRQAQTLRQQLTALQRLLDEKAVPAQLQGVILASAKSRLQPLQAELRRLIESLKRVEQPVEQTLLFIPVVEAVLADTVALTAVLDGLQAGPDAAP